MVWRIFYWNALGPLVQIEHCLIWDVAEWEIRIADVQPTVPQQLHDIVVSIWTKSLRNVASTVLNLCHKELKQFCRQKVVQCMHTYI